MLKGISGVLVIAFTTATIAAAGRPDATSMRDPELGDHWTYTQRDEVTGEDKGTYTQTVTDTRGEEISVLVTMEGKASGLETFDRQWNMTDSLRWRYSPHDGFGIRRPLVVGAAWTVDVGRTSTMGRSVTSKGSRTVRVVGEGQVTTRAGQFDAFEIENSFRNEGDGSAKTEQEGVLRIWYAPAIDHWVKRVTEAQLDGGRATKSTEELVAYGRLKDN